MEVAACGLCGTDLHILHQQYESYPPVTLGHEYTGRIVEIGEGVEGWYPGDRVVVEQHAGACGTCDLCRRGNVHLCTHERPPGSGINDALALRVLVAGLSCPPGPGRRHRPGCGDLRSTGHRPHRTRIDTLQPGESVAVTGPGPVGLLAALAARHLELLGLRVSRGHRAGHYQPLSFGACLRARAGDARQFQLRPGQDVGRFVRRRRCGGIARHRAWPHPACPAEALDGPRR